MNSDYILFQGDKSSDVLIVAFSHVGYPVKKFAFTNAFEHLKCNKLFINDFGNGWYQNGIRGFGVDIDDSAKRLKEFIDNLHMRRVIFIGMSMGGYGALLFGLLTNANIILCFTAEIMIGIPRTRSFNENEIKYYNPKYSNLSYLIKKNTKTQIFFIYGEDDLIDLSLLWPISSEICEEKK